MSDRLGKEEISHADAEGGMRCGWKDRSPTCLDLSASQQLRGLCADADASGAKTGSGTPADELTRREVYSSLPECNW